MSRPAATSLIPPIGALLVLLVGAIAWAADPPAKPSGKAADPAAERSAMLAALDNDDYKVRQAATIALLRDERITIDELVALRDAATTPEQEYRIMLVAEHHIIRHTWMSHVKAEGAAADPKPPVLTNDDDGMIGCGLEAPTEVTLDGKNVAAISIGDRAPGFPAYRWLETGDQLVAVDGKTVDAKQAQGDVLNGFRLMIAGHKGGEKVKLTVLRHGKKVDVTVPCAPASAYHAVHNSSNAIYQEYQQAWAKFQKKKPLSGQWRKADAD